MAKNPNLVPEQRADKNGVVTTKWVKPIGGGKLSMSSVPAPITRSSFPREILIRDAALAFVNEVSDFDDDEDMDEFYNTTKEDIERFSSRTLDDFINASNDTGMAVWGFKYMMENGMPEPAIRDYLNLTNAFHENDFEDADEAARFVMGFDQYEGIEPLVEVEGEYPERRKEQCEALIAVAHWVETLVVDEDIPEDALTHVPIGDGNTAPVISDDELSSLTIERPEEAKRITQYMSYSRSANIGGIQEFLKDYHYSLSDGIL